MTDETTNAVEADATESNNEILDQESANDQEDVGDIAPDENETENSDTADETIAKKNSFQKRREKYKKNLDDARLEAEYWKSQAMRTTQPEAPKVTTKLAVKPKLIDFDDVEQYVEAREQYLIDTVLESKLQEKLQASTKQDTMAKVVETYQSRVAEQSKDLEDYEEVVSELIDLPTDMQEALLTSDIGPRVTYHLALNPDEADRLVKLSPVRRLVELGKLEDKLQPNKTRKSVTSAPPKTSGLKGGTTKATVPTSTSEAKTFAEYKAIREAQLKKRK